MMNVMVRNLNNKILFVEFSIQNVNNFSSLFSIPTSITTLFLLPYV